MSFDLNLAAKSAMGWYLCFPYYSTVKLLHKFGQKTRHGVDKA
jgi:hypothetical protein